MFSIIKHGIHVICLIGWIALLKRNGLRDKKLDQKELVHFKELLMANSIQVDALSQLLIEKGVYENTIQFPIHMAGIPDPAVYHKYLFQLVLFQYYRYNRQKISYDTKGE